MFRANRRLRRAGIGQGDFRQAEPEPAATLKGCIAEAEALAAQADRLIHQTKQSIDAKSEASAPAAPVDEV